MNKYKAAIFDVDGTLLNTRNGILKAVGRTLSEFGMRQLLKEEEKYFCGPPIQKSLMQVYGVSKEEAQEFATAFREIYKQPEYLLDACVYDGVKELFEELYSRDIKIAVATYKREDYAIEIVEHFGLTRRAAVVHGADNFNKLTKSDIIKLCISDMKLTDPSEAVMIGDSDNDAIGAKGIGCPFIGVTYGFGFTSASDVNEFDNIGAADTPAGIMRYI